MALAWFPKCSPLLGERGIVHVYIFREFLPSLLSKLELNVAERRVMGYTFWSQAGEFRVETIHISRNSVEEAATSSGWGLWKWNGLTPRVVARAIGRVLAHELAHCLLGPSHSETGILKQKLSRDALTDFRPLGLHITRAQAKALRSVVEMRTEQVLAASRTTPKSAVELSQRR